MLFNKLPRNKSIRKAYLNLELSPLPDHKYLLKKKYTIVGVSIPRGYVTNGANIPRVLWPLISPPNESTLMPAVTLHDYLCRIAINKAEYDYADEKFLEALKYLSIHPIKIYILITGVKIYSIIMRPSLMKLKLYKKD